MERGIYFDAWYRNNHCYHPSLPMRNMQMIEDIMKYNGTLLVWAALGGGSISLPYLEHEAFGEVDPRLRFYGYMNDSEFISECNKRSIKVFAIVFEVQGWELPAIFDDKGNFKQFNVMHSDSNHEWYGLREFSNGTHENSFVKRLNDYYKNGIVNSEGETVKDLWSECAAVDYNGTPINARWVEIVGHKAICYQTCRNNPVWRTYLKKIIEIQIDAGVNGILLDEAELPITSLSHGGCFCKDCKKQFRQYLNVLHMGGRLSCEYDEIDFGNFDYGEYLKSKGINFPKDSKGVPFFREYYEFQLRAIKKYFTELVDFAKNYGKEKYNKDILVSGNFFNLMSVYYPFENTVDLVITEMERTLFKQPYWYRYAAGFSGAKPVIVVENPYGGIIPELLEQLENGKGYDLYRLLILEAAAYGCNMAIPYGAWMGNTIKNAFYPPPNVTVEVQSFLAANERFFTKAYGNRTAVLYSWSSNYWVEITKLSTEHIDDCYDSILLYAQTDLNNPKTSRLPFWECIKALSDEQVMYDIKMLADGEMRSDSFTINDLKGVELLVLPDCWNLTKNQADVLYQYTVSGRKMFIWGRIGENITDFKEKLSGFDNAIFCENFTLKPEAISILKKTIALYYNDNSVWQVKTDKSDVGVQLHNNSEHKSIHLINYHYDSSCDCIRNIPEITVQINMTVGKIKIHTLTGPDIKFDINEKDGLTYVTLFDMPLYAIIEI